MRRKISGCAALALACCMLCGLASANARSAPPVPMPVAEMASQMQALTEQSAPGRWHCRFEPLTDGGAVAEAKRLDGTRVLEIYRLQWRWTGWLWEPVYMLHNLLEGS